MNIENLANSMVPDITTIKVRFQEDIHDGIQRTYKYLAPKSLDLKFGDHVAVQTGTKAGQKIACVIHVDKEPVIDLDAGYNLKWAFDRVDMNKLEELVNTGRKIHRELRAERQKQAREGALRALGISDPEQFALRFQPEGEK